MTTQHTAAAVANSPHYPTQRARVGTTRDNAIYQIRPIYTEDAGRERAFIMALSSESRYSRMLYGMGEPPPDLVDRFVNVDSHHTMAFVALLGQGDEQRIIGVARYAANRDGAMSSPSQSPTHGSSEESPPPYHSCCLTTRA